MALDDDRHGPVTSPILSLQRLSMAYSEHFRLASRLGSDDAVRKKFESPNTGVTYQWSELKERLTDAIRVCNPRGIASRELEAFAGQMEMYIHAPTLRSSPSFSSAHKNVRRVVDDLGLVDAATDNPRAPVDPPAMKDVFRVQPPKRSVSRNDSVPAKIVSSGQVSAPGRPGLFLGSSAEHVEQVAALTLLLTRHFEVIAWSDSAFGAGRTTIDELIRLSRRVRYAAFIVDADDTAVVRTSQKVLARDNVVFELGLFMGALSPERVFMIYDTNKKPDLASDLAGITLIEYFPHSQEGEWHHALSPAATQILNAKARIERAGK